MIEQMTNNTNSQACAWIAKLHGGEPTAQEKQQLHEWMAQSPAHKAEIRKVAQLWGELNVLTELSVPVDPPAKASMFSLWRPNLESLRDWRLGVGGVCAAMILLAVIIMPGTFIKPDPNTYSTAIGQQQLVTLADGSTILLNTNSQVRVDYQTDARNIYLQQGQAHFEVATNKTRPFKVYVGQDMVRAVGTAFTVYINKQLVEVTVTEGVVELNSLEPIDSPERIDSLEPIDSPERVSRLEPIDSSELVDMPERINSHEPTNSPAPSSNIVKTATAYQPIGLVKAGQNVTINAADASTPEIITIDTQELSRKLAWHHGMLRFSGDSLQDVIAEISRYTDLNIEIVDPSISQLRIGGFFKVGETDKMFEALETNFGIQVVHVDSKQVQLIAADSH